MRRIILTVVLMTLTSSSPFAMAAIDCTGSFTQILAPQSVSNPDNNLYIGGEILPYDNIYMVIRYCGNTAVDNPVSAWSPSMYTGFTPPSPASSWQRCAVNQQDYTAFQMQGTNVGSFINTFSFAWQNIVGGGPQTVYAYDWSQAKAVYTKSDSSLVVQANAKVPWVYRPNAGTDPNGCVPQLTFTFAFSETGTGHLPLNWVVLLYDPRQSKATYENILWDAYNNQYFVSVALNNNLNYITPGCSSAVAQYQTFTGYKFFRAHVTRTNFTNAVNAVNSKIGYSYYSTTPDNYKLISARVMVEIAPWPQGENASVGATFKDFGVYKHTYSSTPEPGWAASPNPANGATGVSITPTLSWTAGGNTTYHNFYIGSSPAVQLTNPTYSPGTLQHNTTYWWRVDEVGTGGTTTGDIWSFRTN